MCNSHFESLWNQKFEIYRHLQMRDCFGVIFRGESNCIVAGDYNFEGDKKYKKNFPLAKKAYYMEMIGRTTRRERSPPTRNSDSRRHCPPPHTAGGSPPHPSQVRLPNFAVPK